MAVEIGQDAPGFALRNQHGEVITARELRGAPALLVFYPYAFSGICSSELTQLQQGLGEIRAADVRLLAISVDTIFALRTFAEQLGLGFDLLSDFWPHGEIAQAYGVFDQEMGCAVRGSFLLDADGIVRWSMINQIGQARDIAEHLQAVR
ncbi:MAG TPA: peroxiredoxin [Microlunatus sp.]